MLLRASIGARLVVSVLLVAASTTADTFISLHGSGTTNPSKCYWDVMNEIMTFSKLPIRMTYRAVGSTVGMTEFVNANDVTNPANHFGSGDIPVTAALFQNLTAANLGMYHLPILVGTVSFFHSIPGVTQLNMTGELLTKIYTYDITEWDHPDIRQINPALSFETGTNTTIFLAKRVRGSSSTSAVTEFLNKQMPDLWPSNLVSALPTWPTPPETLGYNPNLSCVDGSAGMVACIRGTPFTLGYAESGHGLDAGLPEIRLQNADATRFMTSLESIANNGVEAAEENVFPPSPTDDFSAVTLIDRPGDYTWPMVLVTYLYVRQDLDFLTPDQQGVLIAFLQALRDPLFVTICANDHGFMLPGPTIGEYYDAAVQTLVNDHPNATRFTFEGTSTQTILGMGDYVISTKRASTYTNADRDDLNKVVKMVESNIMSSAVQLERAQSEIETLQRRIQTQEADLQQLRGLVAQLDDQVTTLRGTVSGVGTDPVKGEVQRLEEFGDDEQRQLTAALVLATMSFVFWVIFILVKAVSFMNKP